MAKKKRRPNPIRLEEGVLVVAKHNFCARTSADIPLHKSIPPSRHIPQGTAGILYGKALGNPELRIVEFEWGDDGELVRMEVLLNDIENAQ